MSSALQLEGQRFGRLVVLRRLGSSNRNGQHRSLWLCRCDCGKEHQAEGYELRAGRIASCGCARADAMRALGARAARSRASAARSGQRVYKASRIADAFAEVFRVPADTTHVDRPGARVVRGRRY